MERFRHNDESDILCIFLEVYYIKLFIKYSTVKAVKSLALALKVRSLLTSKHFSITDEWSLLHHAPVDRRMRRRLIFLLEERRDRRRDTVRLLRGPPRRGRWWSIGRCLVHFASIRFDVCWSYRAKHPLQSQIQNSIANAAENLRLRSRTNIHHTELQVETYKMLLTCTDCRKEWDR